MNKKLVGTMETSNVSWSIIGTSDSLSFIGKSGLTYGWQPTLNNYILSYPDKSAMGKLTFTNEVKDFIDIETVQVIGKWELKRDSLENLGGYLFSFMENEK